MKNALLFLFSIAIGTTTFGQFGQIENGGFENWQTETVYEEPIVWNTSNTLEFTGTSNLTQSTDANDGNYSVRFGVDVINQDTISSYIYLGNIDQNGGGPDAGIPYADNFEAFMIDVKGDLQTGDTLNLLMIRYLAGNAVDFQIKPLLYGTQSTWTTNLIVVGNQAQDSIFIGIILGDPNGSISPKPSSWAQVDNVRTISGGIEQTPVPNHSFENWHDIVTENPTSWSSINYLLTGTNNENTTKSTDSNTGQYAVQLETISIDSDTIQAYLSSGDIDIYYGNFGLIPYNTIPTNVSGAYKYTSVNGSTGELNIIFYQGGTPIGAHTETFTNQSSYTNFNASLTIAGTPDSILIIANSGDEIGATLLLDDLLFSGGSVSLNELLSVDYQMYPNPAKNIVSIRLPNEGEYTISMNDIHGKEMMQVIHQSGLASISIQNFAPGIYFVTVYNDFSKETKRLIVE